MTETTWTNPNHLAVREQFEQPEFHSHGVIANVAGPGGRYAILRDGEALAIHRVDPTRVLRSVGEFLAAFPDGITDYDGAWSMERWPYFIVVDTEALSARGRGLDDGVLCYDLGEALAAAERLAAEEQPVDQGALRDLVDSLTEDQALDLFHAMARRFGWGWLVMTRDDAEQHVERPLTDEEWDRLSRSKGWRYMVDSEYVAEAVDMAFRWAEVPMGYPQPG